MAIGSCLQSLLILQECRNHCLLLVAYKALIWPLYPTLKKKIKNINELMKINMYNTAKRYACKRENTMKLTT